MQDKIYIITAHKSPKQLERLLHQLNDAYSSFYIHIDLKSDIGDFEYLENIKNVELIKNRVNCIWGDFSQCIATLNLIEVALNNHTSGFCMFLSGDDYPLKPLREMDKFILQNYDTVFMNVKYAYEKWPSFDERVSKYKINKSSKREDFLLLKGLNRQTVESLLKGYITILQFLKICFIQRRLKTRSKFYGGSNWWQMNIPSLKKVYSYIIDNKAELFEFYKYSKCCDEFFFQTALMEVENTAASFEIENTLTYTDWRKKASGPHTFTKSDVDLLKHKSSKYLFARKFDLEIDTEILDLIDDYKSRHFNDDE